MGDSKQNAVSWLDAHYCIACGVAWELHPSEGASKDPVECGVAVRKAELLEAAFNLRGDRG